MNFDVDTVDLKNDTMIIMPHLDDESFLMGGYLSKYFGHKTPFSCTILTVCGFGRGENIHKNGEFRIAQLKTNVKNLHNVNVKFLSYRDCTLETTDIPNIVDSINVLLKTKKFSKVFIPSESDLHQDHRIVSQACKIALRDPEFYHVKEIYECPAPYSGVYPNYRPVCNCILNLEPITLLGKKITMSERYSETENVPESVYVPIEYFNLIWKAF